ncbi:MAG: hypothetical protein JKY03_00435 [Aureispira sp.]|nr:hypothetical protein [Aureispira sp.]
MKIVLLKYLCLPIVCFASGYSYVFLDSQTMLLNEVFIKKTAPQEKRIVIHNAKNNSTQVVIIAPPTDPPEEKKEKEFANKDKNMLPDVEFLKFIIDKSKEGIPVLKFDGFWAAFS